jgi:CheY-like chemotaxis protein
MPDEDGYSLIRRVRELCSADRLPAIALTAYARKQDAEEALAAGFDRHLPKPVAPVELVRAIRTLTGASANAKATAITAGSQTRIVTETLRLP